MGETSDSARWAGRNQLALKAPKKRDESFSGCKSRKQRAYDPDNLSIRAFRLDGNYSDTESTNSSAGSHENPNRVMQANFMEAIMNVEINPTQGPLRA